MTSLAKPEIAGLQASTPDLPTVCVTIPVLNEEIRLALRFPRLMEYLQGVTGLRWEVVIANNGSTDETQSLAERFSRQYPHVRALWLSERGRGGALKRAWIESQADVMTYMDVDLSTDLDAFPKLVQAVASGGFDLAVGSRLAVGAQTQRSWKRELTSRCYVRLIKLLCHTSVSDAQCGFKAISRRAAQVLLPLVEDNGWFFDTELLALAQRLDYRILELPVRWTEDEDSRVNLFDTARRDFQGLLRLRRGMANRALRSSPPAAPTTLTPARTTGAPGRINPLP